MNLCIINLILCFHFVIVVAYGIRSENFVVTAKLWYRLRTRVASGVFCVECLCGTQLAETTYSNTYTSMYVYVNILQLHSRNACVCTFCKSCHTFSTLPTYGLMPLCRHLYSFSHFHSLQLVQELQKKTEENFKQITAVAAFYSPSNRFYTCLHTQVYTCLSGTAFIRTYRKMSNIAAELFFPGTKEFLNHQLK